jgi:class 3 adenylate cyclase/tetratricopeptide (TPR) repeat protein
VDFVAVVDQVIALLRQRGRVTYRTLKRQFQLDDEALDDVKVELIKGQRLAADEDGDVLVWIGAATSPAAPAAVAPTPAPLAYTPPYLAEKILTSRSALEGERKQVTVLFADLKGSTELIRDLDPEAAQRLLDPALQRMMEAVHRYEGTVNQVLGDGIMALFGAPVAHEDHAVRACYAALAMQAAMRRYAEDVRRSHGLEMQARIGLNSGEVVVRSIGNDLHMDYSAVGQTTHLAARMEQMATPGSIRMTAATLRLVDGLVRGTALGWLPVRGLTEPVEVFELTGVTTFRRRFQATVARGLTQFVSRQTELAILRQALARANAGHGQVVAVVGEAGVGKSRLVYECVQVPDTQGWLVLESAAVSYGTATPYFPVVDLLKRYCHVEPQDDPPTVRTKVTGQLLTLDAQLQDTIPALLALLDVLPEDSPFHTLEPAQRRRHLQEALTRLLLHASQEQSLLLVVEDLHWLDTETQDWLDRLVESLPMARLLLLVTYRPEYQHGWGRTTSYTQVRLDPLPSAATDAFLRVLLGDAPGLGPLTQLLIARTAGNPLFLEESVRTLVETGVLVGERGAYRLTQELRTIHVPATVHAVLAARIDRLPPQEKRLVQTAAVIGTDVPFPVLQAITEMPEETLQRGLAHVQTAELLYETRLFPERVYTFKHALTHEVAYGSLLQERRRVLHGRIVEALEGLYTDRLAEQVERLAHHAWRSERWDKALVYLRQAGVKAMARSANREAVGRYEQALDALQHLPECPDTRAQAIDLRLDLRNALHALGDSARIVALLREAEHVAEALDDHQRLAEIANYLSNYFVWMGAPERAVAASQRALTHATECGDVSLQVVIRFNLGWAYATMGEYGPAIDLNRSIAASLQEDMRAGPARGGGFMSVLCRNMLAWLLAECGAFTEGLAYGDDGIRLAETADHPGSLARMYNGVGQLYLRKGDLPQALSLLERAWYCCQAAHIALFAPIIASNLGLAYALSGRVAEALPLLEDAVEQAASRGHMGQQASRLVYLSEGYLLAGRREDARDLAARAGELARLHKERSTQAYALRLRGEIAARGTPPAVELAAVHYRQALALAEELGMCPLQAHCHRGLGMLYATIGQPEQARVELSTAIEMYTSMDMTFWLPQAEAALAQVDA